MENTNSGLKWFENKKKEFKAKLTLTDSKILAIENKYCWTMVNFLTDVIIDINSLNEKNLNTIRDKYNDLGENFEYLMVECKNANFSIQYHSYDELLKITNRVIWVLSKIKK